MKTPQSDSDLKNFHAGSAGAAAHRSSDSTPPAIEASALMKSYGKARALDGLSFSVRAPLTFLSPVFMARELMPPWIRTVAQFNPVNWSIECARAAMSEHPDWMLIGRQIGYLGLFTALSAWIAVRAFRAYQRSI